MFPRVEWPSSEALSKLVGNPRLECANKSGYPAKIPTEKWISHEKFFEAQSPLPVLIFARNNSNPSGGGKLTNIAKKVLNDAFAESLGQLSRVERKRKPDVKAKEEVTKKKKRLEAANAEAESSKKKKILAESKKKAKNLANQRRTASKKMEKFLEIKSVPLPTFRIPLKAPTNSNRIDVPFSRLNPAKVLSSIRSESKKRNARIETKETKNEPSNSFPRQRIHPKVSVKFRPRKESSPGVDSAKMLSKDFATSKEPRAPIPTEQFERKKAPISSLQQQIRLRKLPVVNISPKRNPSEEQWPRDDSPPKAQTSLVERPVVNCVSDKDPRLLKRPSASINPPMPTDYRAIVRLATNNIPVQPTAIEKKKHEYRSKMEKEAPVLTVPLVTSSIATNALTPTSEKISQAITQLQKQSRPSGSGGIVRRCLANVQLPEHELSIYSGGRGRMRDERNHCFTGRERKGVKQLPSDRPFLLSIGRYHLMTAEECKTNNLELACSKVLLNLTVKAHKVAVQSGIISEDHDARMDEDSTPPRFLNRRPHAIYDTYETDRRYQSVSVAKCSAGAYGGTNGAGRLNGVRKSDDAREKFLKDKLDKDELCKRDQTETERIRDQVVCFLQNTLAVILHSPNSPYGDVASTIRNLRETSVPQATKMNLRGYAAYLQLINSFRGMDDIFAYHLRWTHAESHSIHETWLKTVGMADNGYGGQEEDEFEESQEERACDLAEPLAKTAKMLSDSSSSSSQCN